MKRKSIVMTLLLALLLTIGFTACSKTPTPQTLFNINSEEVSKIILRSGRTGQPVTTTDRTIIDKIVSKLNEFTYVGKPFKPEPTPPGWDFDVTIYDANNALIYDFAIIGSTIAYGQFRYESSETSGTVAEDIERIYDSSVADLPSPLPSSPTPWPASNSDLPSSP